MTVKASLHIQELCREAFHIALFVLPEFRRCLVAVLFERAVEIGDIVEACFIGHFNNRLVGGTQHSHGLGHTVFYDIINARHAGDISEKTRQSRLTEIDQLGKPGKRDILHVILRNIIHHFPHFISMYP